MSRPRRTLFGVLCIRADAGRYAGTGHVMRCLAIAQAWLGRGGRVVWGMAPETSALVDRLSAEGVNVVAIHSTPASAQDANETGRLAQENNAEWVVLDGYHFSTDYRTQLKRSGCRLLMVDDLADSVLSPADVILNYNVYATDSMYVGKSGGARLLLGPAYSPLRREFLPWRTTGRQFPAQAKRVLVTFGGADPGNVTLQAMRLLAELTELRLQVTVVVGAANSNLAKLKEAMPGLEGAHDAELVINPPNLPELMSRADLVISAAGSSWMELAFLGAPTALTAIVHNQRLVADRLCGLGAVARLALGEQGYSRADKETLGELLASAAKREQLSRTISGLADEWGAVRVVEALANHPIQLRAAVASDARILWEWANDPDTRAASYNSTPISWETHAAWFQRRQQEPDKTAFYLGSTSPNELVGVVRFDFNEEYAVISVNLAPAARGRGWGARLIRAGAVRALSVGPCREVRGWVKTSNAPSLAAFHRAGFRLHDHGIVQGAESAEFRLSRADVTPVFPRPDSASP